MKPIKVDVIKNEVIMTRKFAAAASDPHTKEYATLQDVLKTHPNINVRMHTIKKNTSKESYKGLTYDYMRDFIILHEEGEQRAATLAEFDEQILISKCHSKGRRYPTIKKWFLDKYEGVEIFGATEDEIRKMRERKAAEATIMITGIKKVEAEDLARAE